MLQNINLQVVFTSPCFSKHSMLLPGNLSGINCVSVALSDIAIAVSDQVMVMLNGCCESRLDDVIELLTSTNKNHSDGGRWKSWGGA